MPTASEPSAEVLSKILLMHSMIGQLPSAESVLSFVCRGLEDLPGVASASFILGDTTPPHEPHSFTRFSVGVGGQHHADIFVRLDAPASFDHYVDYVKNLAFVAAVVIEEQHQRHRQASMQKELERRVRERTASLTVQIRERRAAEARALAEKARAELYLEVAEAIIVELDTEGRIRVINQRGSEVLGYTPEELLGRDWFETAIPEAERAEVRRHFDQVSTGRAHPIDYHENAILTRDGRSRHIAWHNIVARDASGTVTGRISSGLDITERKQVEEDLAAEKERLAVTLRSIGDGVITTDVQARVTMMNPVAETLTGWTSAEAIGQPFDQVFNVVSTPNDLISRVVATGNVVGIEAPSVLKRRDGTERAIAKSGAPIRDKSSEVIGVILVFRDVTERQEMIESLLRADKLEALGVLAGGIAHDFNNLLSGIYGNLEMARESCDVGCSRAHLLDNALALFPRAQDLTRQFLTFSKGGAPVRRAGSIATLLKDNVPFALVGSNVACEYRIDKDLWASEFDASQMGQVIDNLTINAKQAMKAGGKLTVSARNVTIAAKARANLPPGKYVELSFSDTGHGIDPADLSRIFDPFFTTKPEGSGLGLAMCYSILQKHGGCIDVTSIPAQGTTFNLLIPACEEVVESGALATRPRHRGCGKILVMDDDETVRYVLKAMLERLGYEVIETRDGREAQDLCEQLRDLGEVPKAMLLDLTVPGGIGGTEAAPNLRKLFPDTPLIAASGYSQDPIMAKPLEFGFNDSISKPMRLIDLERVLDANLNSTKHESGPKR